MHFKAFQFEARQLAAKAWTKDLKRSVDEQADRLIARLAEETGELSQALRKYYEGTRFGHQEIPGTRDAIKDELGDGLFLYARIANLYDIDLEESVQMVLAKIEGRIKNDRTVGPEDGRLEDQR